MSGYTDCPCRDCCEIAMDGDLCHECEEAGCDAEGESECSVERFYCAICSAETDEDGGCPVCH